MNNFYIDESGSMTKKYAEAFPFFIICLIKVFEPGKLKHLYKKLFLKKRSLFFTGSDKRIELKGSKLKYDDKKYLAKYFNRPGLFEVYYIKVVNKNLDQSEIYNNKARAFNYLIAKDLEHLFNKKLINYGKYYLYIDNRNVKNESKNSLEDYLNIKFAVERTFLESVEAKYFDSKNVKFIQLADFFSNLFYSDLMTQNFENEMIEYVKNKIIRDIFIFPIKYWIYKCIDVF